MALKFAPAEERQRPEGVDREGRGGDPPLPGLRQSPAPQQQTSQEEGSGAGRLCATDEARNRLGRMKLTAIQEELRRAALSFLAAKRYLGDTSAQETAGRIADALGRACLAIDSIEKGAAVHPAVEALVGASRFDPATRLADFVHLGGKSIALAGKILARCGYESVEYWGRALCRLAQAFMTVRSGHAA